MRALFFTDQAMCDLRSALVVTRWHALLTRASMAVARPAAFQHPGTDFNAARWIFFQTERVQHLVDHERLEVAGILFDTSARTEDRRRTPPVLQRTWRPI